MSRTQTIYYFFGRIEFLPERAFHPRNFFEDLGDDRVGVRLDIVKFQGPSVG